MMTGSSQAETGCAALFGPAPDVRILYSALTAVPLTETISMLPPLPITS